MGLVDSVRGLRYDLRLLGLSLGVFLALIDIYVSTITFYTVGLDNQNPWFMIWTIIGHQIAFAASLPFFEGLVEMRYQRLVFIISAALFSASSAVSGYTDVALILAAFRVGKGFSAAGIFATASVDQSATAQKAVRCAKIIGPIWAGLLGTACMEFARWRWIYWLNGIFGVVALVCYLCSGNDEKWSRDYVPSDSQVSHLDVVGCLLFGVGMFVFTLGSQISANVFWDESWIVPAFGLIVVSLVVFSAFWLWEKSSRQKFGFFQLLSPDASDQKINSQNNSKNISLVLSVALAGFIWDAMLFSLALGFQLVDMPPRRLEYYPAFWSAIRMLPLVIPSRVAIFMGTIAINKGFLVPSSVSYTGNVLMLFSLSMYTLARRFPVGTFTTIQSIAMGLGYGLHLAAHDDIGLNKASTPSQPTYSLSSLLPPLAPSASPSSPQLPGIEEESEDSHDEHEENTTDEETDDEDDLESILSLNNPPNNDKPSQVKLECIRVIGGIFGLSLVNMIFHYNCLEGGDCGKGAFIKSFTVMMPAILLAALCTFAVLFFLGKMRSVYTRVQH